MPHLSGNHIIARSGPRISIDDALSNCASKSRDTERRSSSPHDDPPKIGCSECRIGSDSISPF